MQIDQSSPTTAFVKLKCQIPPRYFTDYLCFLKVEGTWQLPQGELTFKQQFQMLSGTLRNGSVTTPIANAKMNGNQITFTAGQVVYTGRLSGNTLEGTISGANTPWRATRVG